jgi:hypothetical protein
MNWWKDPYYGGSSWYSYIILNLLFMPPGLLLIYIYELILRNLAKILYRNIVKIKYNLLNLPIPAPLSSGKGAGGEVSI